MKKLIRRFIWWVLIVIVVSLASGVWFTTTTQGGRWLIQRIISLSDQSIIVNGFEGTIISQLSIKEARLDHEEEGLTFSLENLQLKWSPRALLDRTLHIESISADMVSLTPAKTSAPSEPVSIPEINLPVAIQLDALEFAQFSINPASSPLQIEDIKLSASMRESTLLIERFHLKQADQVVDVEGHIEFAAPFNVGAKLKLFKQSLNAHANLNLEGEIEHYTLNGQAELTAQSLPSLDANFSGTGSLSSLSLNKLHIKLLDGQLNASGNLQWQKDLQASLSFMGENLNPAKFNEKMSGKLSTQGLIKLKSDVFDVQLSAKGQLRDYPLALDIKAAGTAEQVHLAKGKFNSGPNSFQIQGDLSREAVKNLEWKLDAPDLNTIHPDLEGQAEGEGQLNGAWQSLVANADFHGQTLRFQDTKLASLGLSLVPAQGKLNQFLLRLDANQFTIANREIEQIGLMVAGTFDEQESDFRIADGSNRLTGHLSSKKDNQVWKVSISETTLESNDWPTLTQRQTARLNLDPENLSLTEFCLLGRPESICLKGERQGNTSEADLRVKDVPIVRFEKWLAVAREVKDSLNAEAHLKQKEDKWSVQSSVLLDQQNKLDATVDIDSVTKAIQGKVSIDADKLDWLALVSDQLLQPKGKIRADFALSGTLKQPDLKGEFVVVEAETKLPVAGIELKAINLAVRSVDAARAKISGSMHSGEGRIQLNGEAAWAPLEDWKVALKLTGQNVSLLNLAELKVQGSPDLDVSMQADSLDIDGVVKLPVVSLLLENLPESAVIVSDDVRLVGIGEDQADHTHSNSMAVYADVQLLLGDQVTLKGDGLSARLGGSLKTQLAPGKPLEATGKVEIIEGKYTAYGQDLALSNSAFVFNGPIAQPGLDLKAERIIDELTVGLLISGTLQNPTSTIFSNPSMSDTDAFSYLLTGKPLSSAGATEGSLINSALTSLGVKGSAGLIDKIRNSTGLSTLEIESGSDASQTALLIGKYLTPKLYVQYVKQLFLDTDSIQLQYDISDKLKLEGESGGTSQGVDLFYQFEK